VPLDGSEQARSALPYALTLAGETGTIVLLTVVPPDSAVDEETARSAPHLGLNLVAEELRQAGRQVEVQVASGDPAQEIVAAGKAAATIAIGSHGRGAIGRLIHGSVADAVARAATVPVLVVRAGQPGLAPAVISRLVLPLDGSPLAEAAIPVATALARRLGATLFLVRAVNIAEILPPAVGMGEAIPFDAYDETAQELDTEAREYLEAMAGRLREEGFAVETKVLSGPPAAAIGEATRAGDVVVLCSNERSGVMRWLLGSVTEELMHSDDRPVMLVPAPEAVVAG
jgi:nucleotide-binding universal stress UspA family protein